MMGVSPDSIRLVSWFRRHNTLSDPRECLVAFSGGVDSAVVAKAAVVALGERAVAVCAYSPSMPRSQPREIAFLAEKIGIELIMVESREFDDPAYTANDVERCYHCKTIRMRQILELGRKKKCGLVVDGSNGDDASDYRPGKRALEELGVISPLAELRFSKADVRELAFQWDLPVHDKPAEPCLSTRILYGLELTPERLDRVDRAEQFIRSLRFSPLRVRMHADDHVRIEVDEEKIGEIVALKAPILSHLNALGFRFVSVDLEGFRSGKMNPPGNNR